MRHYLMLSLAILLLASANVKAQTPLTAEQLKGKEYWLKAQEAYKNKNEKECFKNDQKAAKAGYHEGCNSLGVCYGIGISTSKDLNEAIKWYLKAIELGNNLLAMSNLGGAYSKIGDYEKSVYYYRMGIEAGFPYCCFHLANAYLKGKGVQKDEDEAGKLLIKAAEMDIKKSDAWKQIVAEGNECYYEEYLQENNYKTIINDWPLCKKNPYAAYAYDYSNWRLNPNIEKPFEMSFNMGNEQAAEQVLKFAENGNSWAQEQIALCQWTGSNKVIAQNKNKALEFYKKTTDKELSQDILIIAKGEGLYNGEIPKEWYMRKSHSDLLCKAAENGNAEAQFTRGIECDMRGDSSREKWFQLAAAQGHKLANKSLDIIKKDRAEKERIEKQRREEELAKKKNSTGKQIVWTETVTYDIGKGGLGQGLLDLLGGSALHEVSYTIRYTAIVETVIAGESVKCIIKNFEIVDPSFASSNYFKYKRYAIDDISQNVGKTRVLNMDEFQMK